MRSIVVVVLVGCGGGHTATTDAPADTTSDAPACQPQGAIGSFYRRSPNPRLLAGRAHTDGTLEIAIADPDLRWDDTSGLWHVYYHGPRATSYTAPNRQTIEHATSPDLATWTIDDAAALATSTDTA